MIGEVYQTVYISSTASQNIETRMDGTAIAPLNWPPNSAVSLALPKTPTFTIVLDDEDKSSCTSTIAI